MGWLESKHAFRNIQDKKILIWIILMKACYLSFVCVFQNCFIFFHCLSMPTSLSHPWVLADNCNTALYFITILIRQWLYNVHSKMIWFQTAQNAALCRGCGQNCDTSDAICCLEHVLSELLCGKNETREDNVLVLSKFVTKQAYCLFAAFSFSFVRKKGLFW